MLVLLFARRCIKVRAFTLFSGRFSSRYIRRLTQMVSRYLLLGAFDP